MRREIRRFGRNSYVLGICFFILLTLTAFSSAGAFISISVDPNSLPANEKGTALISIADLASSGNRVWVDIFIDANNNGVIDAGEPEVESFAVTDGTGSPQIAGVTNTNVNGDEDGEANSGITTTLKFYDAPFDAGQFIIQATDMGDSSTAKATFTFTQNTSLPQSISGTITCNGSPVAGAFVWIGDSSECDVAGAVTNSSGNYQIYLENPGTYCIDVSAQGYVSNKGNDGDSYLGCIIVDGHETGINLKLFSGTHHITGTIKDENTNEGIGGVWIEAEMENGIEYWSESVSEHDGSFDVIVIDGVWELKAQGLETKGYVEIDNAYDDIIVSGSDVPGKDAFFPPITALITGSVKDENVQPVQAEIYAETEIDGIEYDPDALTDPDGNYVLGVIAGNWGVEAELKCELYLRAPSEQYIDIADNEVETLNFICTQAGAVSGNVKDSNNQPIEGLWVHVFSEACGGEWLGGDHTDCNGDYIIGGLPAGDVYVQTCAGCEGLNYINEWWDNNNGSIDCNGAAPVSVTLGQIHEGINFVLEPGGFISGTVYDSTGTNPLPNVNVVACTFEGGRCWGTCADDEGSYKICGLPDGDYRVQAGGGGCGCEESEDCTGCYVIEYYNEKTSWDDADSVTVSTGSNPTGIDFTLDEGGGISGTVKDSKGDPIEGLWMHIFSDVCGGNWLGGDYTDENGSYTICGLPAGNCYIQACAECCGLDYMSEWYDDKTDCSYADAVYIIVSEITENVDFQLAKLCEGDFDYDGDVDGSDLAVFAADFGRTDCDQGEPCEGDFDYDGDVDGSDLAVFAADFGRTDCPINP